MWELGRHSNYSCVKVEICVHESLSLTLTRGSLGAPAVPGQQHTAGLRCYSPPLARGDARGHRLPISPPRVRAGLCVSLWGSRGGFTYASLTQLSLEAPRFRLFSLNYCTPSVCLSVFFLQRMAFISLIIRIT